jgi:hypothetical protein
MIGSTRHFCGLSFRVGSLEAVDSILAPTGKDRASYAYNDSVVLAGLRLCRPRFGVAGLPPPRPGCDFTLRRRDDAATCWSSNRQKYGVVL